MSNSQADLLAEQIKSAMHASLMSDKVEAQMAGAVDALAALAKQQASPEAQAEWRAFNPSEPDITHAQWQALTQHERLQYRPIPSSDEADTPAGARLTYEVIEELADLYRLREDEGDYFDWQGFAKAIEAKLRASLPQVREQAALPAAEPSPMQLSPEEAAEQIQNAFEDAEKEDDAVRTLIEEGWSWDGDQWQRPAIAQGTTPAAGVELCSCKDRAASACPGEWEPGCDLGNNPAYVRIHAAGVGEQATVNTCKLTECQGQPRCRYCVAKDARDATKPAQAEPYTPQISDAQIDAIPLGNIELWRLIPDECDLAQPLRDFARAAILAEAGIKEKT